MLSRLSLLIRSPPTRRFTHFKHTIMSKTEGATYTHGHHASVLRSHTWRTAANSAAYLLPHLRPGLDLLVVGCGRGGPRPTWPSWSRRAGPSGSTARRSRWRPLAGTQRRAG